MQQRQHMRATAWIVGMAVTTVLVVAACAPATTTTGAAGGSTGTADGRVSGTTPGTTAPPAPRPPYTVTTSTRTFVDHSRPTNAGAQTAAKPERTLETTILVPDAPGPFPLIAFSHGIDGHPDKFTKLLTAWARAGFVVAAPAFPLTNHTVPGANSNWADIANQPADISFVITQVLAADADPHDALAGHIDPDRIGAGGLSLGGGTTYAVTFNDCCRDRRIKAAEVLSGLRFPMAGDYVLDGHVPLLITHGDKDPLLPFASELESFTIAKPPVWFVTLIGAGHAEAYEDTPSPHDAIAEQLTTDFWLGTLGGDPAALARLGTDAASATALATIQSK